MASYFNNINNYLAQDFSPLTFVSLFIIVSFFIGAWLLFSVLSLKLVVFLIVLGVWRQSQDSY